MTENCVYKTSTVDLYEKLNNLIESISYTGENSVCGDGIQRNEEILYEQFSKILDNYQEQPKILDPIIEKLIKKLLEIIKIENEKENKLSYHLAFKFLYHLTKVFNYKKVNRYFPHEVTDLEPVLLLLSKEDSSKTDNWQTKYVLLLWLSIIILIPLDLKRFDSGDDKASITDRIFSVIKDYLQAYGKTSEACAFLSARFLTRPNILNNYLPIFIDWSLNLFNSGNLHSNKGILLALSYIFKIGSRNEVKVFANQILSKVNEIDLRKERHEYFVKLIIKIVQRIGLCFLKTRLSAWRYSRGKRSLIDNLNSSVSALNQSNSSQSTALVTEEDDNNEVDDWEQIENIIEILINSLKHESTIVRWSAAKGIGRITSRLNREMGKEIFSSILDLFNVNENNNTWHGACLATAELGRKGLILPEEFPLVMEVLKKALVYDISKGYYSVGVNVRDAACYICWSFARAYDKDILRDYMQVIAVNLLTVAIFDREINCRRAASAAFQECVGRLGNFYNGIDIITTIDHESVGSLSNSYLELSVFLGKYECYTKPLINHLLNHKISHWDSNIRELTSKALFNLTTVASKEFLSEEVLPKLYTSCFLGDVNSRHGAILAYANVFHGLYKKDFNFSNVHQNQIITLTTTIKEKKWLHIFGSEFMKHSVCVFIELISLSKIDLPEEITELFLDFIKVTLQYVDPKIRKFALKAFKPFCITYFFANRVKQDALQVYLLKEIHDASLEEAKVGALDAVIYLPEIMMEPDLPSVLLNSVMSFLNNNSDEIVKMVHAKASAIICITKIITQLDLKLLFTLTDNLNAIFNYLLTFGLNDYTMSNQGDVGIKVRLASIDSLKELTLHLANNGLVKLIPIEVINEIFIQLSGHCVSSLDKVREKSSSVFYQLLKCGCIVNIPHREGVLEIIKMKETEDEINWQDQTVVYPTFCQFLSLPNYTYSILKGLSTSIGGISASLVNYSRNILYKTLNNIQKSKEADFEFIMRKFLTVFKENLTTERLCKPLILTLDYLLVSGFYDNLPSKEIFDVLDYCWNSSKMSSDILKLEALASLFCSALRMKDEAQTVLKYLMVLLFKKYPKVRTTTADLLYVGILTYGDNIKVNSGESIDLAAELLTESNWSQALNNLKPVREKLFKIFF